LKFNFRLENQHEAPPKNSKGGQESKEGPTLNFT